AEDAHGLVSLHRRARLDVKQGMVAAERLDLLGRDLDEIGARHDAVESLCEIAIDPVQVHRPTTYRLWTMRREPGVRVLQLGQLFIIMMMVVAAEKRTEGAEIALRLWRMAGGQRLDQILLLNGDELMSPVHTCNDFDAVRSHRAAPFRRSALGEE